MEFNLVIGVIVVVLLCLALFAAVTKIQLTAPTNVTGQPGYLPQERSKNVSAESPISPDSEFPSRLTWRRVFFISTCAGVGVALGFLILGGVGLLIFCRIKSLQYMGLRRPLFS